MRDKIVHIRTRIVLDLGLGLADYGHPRGRELLDEAYEQHSKREAYFFECTKCAAGVYLQLRPIHEGSETKQYCSPHFDRNLCTQPGPKMSDEHKRQVEYISTAGENAGYHVNTEVRVSPRVRPDAVIYGLADIGIEVQRSALGKLAAIGRTRKAMDAGLATSLWFNDNPEKAPPWRYLVPSIGMNRLPWDVTPPARAVTATWIRKIKPLRCTVDHFDKCPEGNKRHCLRWHPKSYPWSGLTVDDVIEQTPAGLIIPFQFGKSVVLAPRESKTQYEELTGKTATFDPVMTPPRVTQRPSRIECANPAVTIYDEPDIGPHGQLRIPLDLVEFFASRADRCSRCGFHVPTQGHRSPCV